MQTASHSSPTSLNHLKVINAERHSVTSEPPYLKLQPQMKTETPSQTPMQVGRQLAALRRISLTPAQQREIMAEAITTALTMMDANVSCISVPVSGFRITELNPAISRL